MKTKWAVKWRSENRMDGKREYLCTLPKHNRSGYLEMAIFETRAKAREWKRERYDYIRLSPVLRAEPYGWKVPKVVKVAVIVEEVDE